MRVSKTHLNQEYLGPLVARAKLGDSEAATEIARVIRPIVVGLVKKDGYTEDQRSDQEAAAWLGVWEAVHRYDPEHDSNAEFATIAYWWIRHYTHEWRARNSGALPMPRTGAWASATKIDEELEEWAVANPDKPFPEDFLSDEDLDAVTGVRNTRAILRAKAAPFPIVMDHDAGEAPSAEDTYFEEADSSLDSRVVTFCAAVMEKPEAVRYQYALDFIDAEGLDIKAEDLLEAAEAYKEATT